MTSNNFKKIIRERGGQSLGEVLVGLTIGAILIGAASFLIVNSLRSNASLERSQKGSQVAQELLDKIRSWGGANWFNVYNLSKGSDNKYFLNASGTELFVISGEESVLSNDVFNGLIAHWKLDESTSTLVYDSTGNNVTGTLISAPIRATSSCKIGNCLLFNGSSNYVSASGLTQTSARSYSWWHKISANGSAVFPSPISHGGYSNGMRVIWRDDSSDITTVQITTGSDNTPTFTLSGGSVDQVGIWYHYVLTYDGVSVGKLYRDGILTDTKSNGTGVIVNTASPFYIGRGQYYWNGSVDDVRVYNRVLSADEAKKIFQSSIYTRNFYVENVCRSTGATGEIVSAGGACAGGSSDDPSTQKITVSVSWPTGVTTTQLTLTDYLTRWKNAIFEQSDWSGGVDSSGAYSGFANVYSSTTNTDTSAGGVILDLP